ncbi:MAG: hypothetical protein KAJ03_04460 [Gammaproteobacteria bacterium]|nr:hypothetical protein [Gammaproteobacteria bacterium]
MTILTAQNTFTITAGTLQEVQTTLFVSVAGGPGTAKGRLIHPVLGTYDYEKEPDEWFGIDADIFIEPVWANVRTLSGAANTLWDGYVADVETEEKWLSPKGVSMTRNQMQTILSFYQNPPDPDVAGFVQWYPSYTSALGYNVVMTGVTIGGRKMTLDHLTNHRDLVAKPVTLLMRIVSRA